MTDFFKPFDLSVYFIIIALIAIPFWLFFTKNDTMPQYAVVFVNGSLKYKFKLSNEKKLYSISHINGKLVAECENFGIRIAEADCPNKLCVKQGRISKSGDIIVCAPFKVVVQIESSDESIDGILK